MRNRWLVGTLAVLGLTLVVARATTKAQVKTPILALPPEPSTRKEAPQRWRTAGEGSSKLVGDPRASDDLSLPPPAARRAEPNVGDDPMGTVDSFLQRSRKEADDSIKALTQEAESLRARLQKVEAALARWQGVSQALNQEPKSPVANLPAAQPEAVKPPDGLLPTLPTDPAAPPLSVGPDPSPHPVPPPTLPNPSGAGSPPASPPPPR